MTFSVHTDASGDIVGVATTTYGLQGGKRATRLAFFIAGFGIACWAPLVPFAQVRLQADSAMLGSILLCLGLGAVVGMPIAGALSTRIGARLVIIAGALGLILALPLLAVLSGSVLLGLSLLLFGASIGAIDVAANVHGIEVQNAAAVPLMSGFHGFYSIGGLVGAGGMTAMISAGIPVAIAAPLAAVIILGCILIAIPGFLSTRSVEAQPLLVLPRGSVLVIGLLAFTIFLAEGAMLDWSALLLTQVKRMEVSVSGAGYAVFALALTVSRLVGDRVVALAGDRLVLAAGMLLTAVGLALSAIADSIAVILAAMALAGLAAGNVVPVVFTLAGRQRMMPAPHAIAAASMLGYLGVLVGPALIGYVAHFIGLIGAFCAVAALVLVSVCATPCIACSGGRDGQC